MSLAKRDKAIQAMITEVENKRQFLLNKYKELHNDAAENELLKDVLEDYLIYYNDIKNEKGKQYNALMKTLEHVDTITASEEHTRNNIKFDQREILNEMKKIKREMQVLTPTKK